MNVLDELLIIIFNETLALLLCCTWLCALHSSTQSEGFNDLEPNLSVAGFYIWTLLDQVRNATEEL